MALSAHFGIFRLVIAAVSSWEQVYLLSKALICLCALAFIVSLGQKCAVQIQRLWIKADPVRYHTQLLRRILEQVRLRNIFGRYTSLTNPILLSAARRRFICHLMMNIAHALVQVLSPPGLLKHEGFSLMRRLRAIALSKGTECIRRHKHGVLMKATVSSTNFRK